jgi:hypothetical protein
MASDDGAFSTCASSDGLYVFAFLTASSAHPDEFLPRRGGPLELDSRRYRGTRDIGNRPRCCMASSFVWRSPVFGVQAHDLGGLHESASGAVGALARDRNDCTDASQPPVSGTPIGGLRGIDRHCLLWGRKRLPLRDRRSPLAGGCRSVEFRSSVHTEQLSRCPRTARECAMDSAPVSVDGGVLAGEV